jgi:hypothetical protein
MSTPHTPVLRGLVRITGALAALLTALGGPAALAAAPPVRLPPDQETTVRGIDVACTGIGRNVREEPRWRAYNVKVEFSDRRGDLLASERVTLSDLNGAPLLNLRCGGAWLLLKLPPGQEYRVSAFLGEPRVAPQTAVVTAPRRGQATVVLTFPGGR